MPIKDELALSNRVWADDGCRCKFGRKVISISVLICITNAKHVLERLISELVSPSGQSGANLISFFTLVENLQLIIRPKNDLNFVNIFFIRPLPELLPVLGPLEW